MLKRTRPPIKNRTGGLPAYGSHLGEHSEMSSAGSPINLGLPLLASVAGFALVATFVLWIGYGTASGTIESGAVLRNIWPLAAVGLLSAIPTLVFIRNAGAISVRPTAKIWRASAALLAVAGGLGALLAVSILRGFANSGDEYGYLFEAQTFLAGRLWLPLEPGHEFFSFFHIVERDGKLVSQYPPGWPAVLAAFRVVGLPFWFVNPLLSIFLLLGLAKFCEREHGPAAALAAVAMAAITPFFLFNAGSYFTHISAALCGLSFCYFGRSFLDLPSWRPAAIAGAALGVLGTIRPYDVLFFAAPFAGELLLKGGRRHYLHLPVVGLAGLPFLAALLYVNQAVTGNPLLLVESWGSPLLKLGLYPVDEDGHRYTPLNSALIAAHEIGLLGKWTSPIFLLACVPAFFLKLRRHQLRFHDFVFPAAMLAYFFFFSPGGNRYGPRYYFDAWPLLVATVAWAFAELFEKHDRRPASAAALGLLATHVATGVAAFIVLAVVMRAVVDQRMDIYEAVDRADLHHAVVVVRSGTGVLSPMEIGDLLRNGITRTEDVLYAQSIPGRDSELRSLYPDRRFYAYERNAGEAAGRLVPVD
jgi:hypothetical protein